MPFYISANRVEMAVEFDVRVSENAKPESGKIRIPFPILFLSFFLKMLRTVELYDHLCFCAVEIHDIGTDHLLPLKRNREQTQKIKPEMPFFFGHIAAQILRERFQIRVAVFVHSSAVSAATITA